LAVRGVDGMPGFVDEAFINGKPRQIVWMDSVYPRKRPGERYRVGVVKSLARWGCGPVGLVHTQKIEAQSKKPTCVSCLT